MGIAFKALSEGMTALFGAGGLFADIGASFAKFLNFLLRQEKYMNPLVC